MNPEELKLSYDREIKILLDNWLKSDAEYWTYLHQFFYRMADGKTINSAVKPFSIKEAEKLNKLRGIVEKERKKYEEAFGKWFSLFG